MELFKLVGEVALNGTDNVKNELDDISDKGEQSENRLVSAFKKIGGAVITYFAVDKIVSFGRELANTSASVAAENSAFAQIMGNFSENAKNKLQEVADATGVMSTRLTPYMTSLTAKFKGLGFGIDEATTFATQGLLLASDASAFWDMSLDESMSHLNSFINGSYEGGEAIGLFANDTQMAQYAIRTGLIASKKEWAELEEATKQATRLEFAQAMMESSGAVGQASKEADQNANVTANLTEKWRQFKAEVGEPILQNIVLPVMEKMSVAIDKLSAGYKELKIRLEEAKKWFDENRNTIDATIGIIEVLTATFIGLKAGMMIQSAIQGFQKAKIAISLLSLEVGKANLAQQALNGTMTIGETIVALLTGKMTLAQLATGLMTKAQTALNIAMNANPIALIITAIVGLIAIIVVLWNKCDWFREGVINIFEGIKNMFFSFIDFVKNNWKSLLLMLVNPFAGAFKLIYDNCEGFRNIVDNTVNSIKNFFIGLWEGIKSVFESIKNVIWVAIQFIGQLFNLLIDIILIPWNFIWVNFGETIMEWINIAKQWLIDLWTTFSTWISGIWTSITEFFTGIWTAITTWLNDIWTTISTWFNDMVSMVANWLLGVWTTIKEWFNGLASIIANWLLGIWTNIKEWFNRIKESIVEAVTNAKNAITERFNAMKDVISEKVNAMKTTVTDVFNKIKTAITTPIENAKNAVSNTVDKIKSMFNFKVSLPNIKLPHFSVTPKGWELGDLLKGKVPKLGIEWYAKAMDKGMILDEPTIFGINSNGIPMGAGEAGSETVVGTNSLMNMIDKAVKNNIPQTDTSGIERKLDKIMNTMLKMKIELDDEVVGNFVVRTVEKEVFN